MEEADIQELLDRLERMEDTQQEMRNTLTYIERLMGEGIALLTEIRDK